MSKTQQQTIFGTEVREVVDIQTTGRVIRPWKQMLSQVSSEWKFELSDSGISVDAVDKANVLAIFTEIDSAAFDAYSLEQETSVGVTESQLGSVLQHARYGKSSDDPISIIADEEQVRSIVTRDFAGADAELTEQMGLLDPGSVREQPDYADLELDMSAELPPQAFVEAIRAMDTSGHIKIANKGGSLVFHQEDDIREGSIEIDCDTEGTGEFTYFTGSYLEDIANGLSSGLVDDITLKWREEFPLFVEFEREDVYSGEYMVAPRLKRD